METINHPKHYQYAASLARPILKLLIDEALLELECIEAIERLNLNFNAGNVLKYLWRVGLKAVFALEDLQKARWYLMRCHNQGHLCGLGNTAKALAELDELIKVVISE